VYIEIVGGRDWPGRGARHLGHQSAAVHCHSLDRLNTINDSLKKKKRDRKPIRTP